MERVKRHIDEGVKHAKRHWVLVVLLLALFAWVAYSYVQKGVMYSIVHTDMDAVVGFLQRFGAYAAIVFVILVAVEVILAPLSPLVLDIAGGAVFGWFWGGTLAVLGNIIGTAISFLLAKNYGRAIIEEHIDPKHQQRFNAFTEKYGAYALFFLRVNPLTSSDIFGYLAGLTAMRMRSAVIATALGVAPLIYIKTYFGGEFVTRMPVLSLIFLAFGMAAVLIVAYMLILIAKKKIEKR